MSLMEKKQWETFSAWSIAKSKLPDWQLHEDLFNKTVKGKKNKAAYLKKNISYFLSQCL